MAEIILGRSKFHSRKTASDNANELRVIGAGLPRTGTSSLKAALEILGFGPCHHMSELFDKPEQSILFARALDGYKTDFHELLKGYGSSVDAPTALFYKEIHQAYPKAKVILTVRDTGEKWFESLKNSVGPIGSDIFYYIAIYPIRHLRLQCIVARKIGKKWMNEYDQVGPHVHELHNARVIKENKQDELLVFNVKEGWSPLCRFLNVPVPEGIPFPNVNDTQYIQRGIRMARTAGLCAWACIIAVIAIILYFFI
ncbi:unnamed protein product [Rotaria sp. Silwood2]|nr:unnamed protein product [Rotaria sp. Silwood2]CAF2520349.1 unnamed protein product [Rotaria sp. Silwood2]CAF3150900.1 unnamed protein product [Rotaria sp. Silwood2]CAF3977918.1 unnamed protein product [Rotaria sp. Silwood2]CAF4116579.1 unnamed protein product [Rotaria sp. Silwood2]